MVSFAMKQLSRAIARQTTIGIVLCFAYFYASVSGSAQTVAPTQSPDVDVRNAKAEFISNNDKPLFVVRDIVVQGNVDTLDVVVHPSAIQSIDGKYRYKPKVVSITRVDSNVQILIELTGKGVPLPDDSVRGSMRLSVRGAGTFRGSRVVFESKRFEVFVANAPLPEIVIITNNIQVDPIFDSQTGVFHVWGLRIRQSKREAINSVPDTRELRIEGVSARIVKAEVGEVDSPNRYSVVAVDGHNRKTIGFAGDKYIPDSEAYNLAFQLKGSRFPLKKGMVKGNATIEFSVVGTHGGATRRRVKVHQVPISN